jgi:hypothetical protein
MAGDRGSVELFYRSSEAADDVVSVSPDEPLPVTLSSGIPGKAKGLSAGNTAQTVATPRDGKIRQLIYVIAHYSAAPTQTGVVVSLIPESGSTYASAISTGSANAQDTSYVPGAPLYLLPGDVLSVLAPAAGGVITSAVTIAWREVA